MRIDARAWLRALFHALNRDRGFGNFLLLLIFALPLRLLIVSTFHAPAGDGIDYFQLSQELSRAGRFAYGATLPESFSRLPGYPLFLAYVAVRKAPLSLDAHLHYATRANVILDALTALLVFLLLRECSRDAGRCRGLPLPHWAPLVGGGLALFYPLQVLLSTYGLSESLSTFLVTLEMYLALRAMRARLFRHAILCGVVAGAAQLGRLDALTVAPAVGLAIFYAAAPLHKRLLALALFAMTATLVFAPWPLRNLARFHDAHVSGAYLRLRSDGRPLPDGIITWARTWATGAPGESYLDLALTLGLPLNINRFSNVTYSSDAAERLQLAAIFAQYNKDGLTASVDESFRALARQRFLRQPLRVLLLLPLLRLLHLWGPESELPLRVPWLGLPDKHFVFAYVDLALYGLALLGAIALWRQGPSGRRRLYIFGAAILGRNLLYAFAVPNAVNQRFLCEALPVLFALAALSTLHQGARSTTNTDTMTQRAGDLPQAPQVT